MCALLPFKFRPPLVETRKKEEAVVLGDVFETLLWKSRKIVENVSWKSEQTEHCALCFSPRPKMEKSDIMGYSRVFKSTYKSNKVR